jgi:hypothetical protein
MVSPSSIYNNLLFFILMHRFDPKNKDKLAVEIEDDIYCRHITEAYRKLDILKSTICDDQQAKE